MTDLAALRTDHHPDRIAERLESETRPSYLADFLYGSIDGTVTTFALISGVAGAGLSSNVIIVLGLANLVGDGFSMAASNYSGIRAERQRMAAARLAEEDEIRRYPDGEREEVRQIFAGKGFEGEALESAVQAITSDHDRWVEMMLVDELHLPPVIREPWRAAVLTMVSFVLVGAIPLLPFLGLSVVGGSAETDGTTSYVASCVLTAVAFFSVGAFKGRCVGQTWWASGSETLGLGGVAATLAFLVGWLLHGWIA